MTDIYLHFLFKHYGLYGNAPVRWARLVLLLLLLALSLPSAPSTALSSAYVVAATRGNGLRDGCDLLAELPAWVNPVGTVCFHIIGHLETMHE